MKVVPSVLYLRGFMVERIRHVPRLGILLITFIPLIVYPSNFLDNSAYWNMQLAHAENMREAIFTTFRVSGHINGMFSLATDGSIARQDSDLNNAVGGTWSADVYRGALQNFTMSFGVTSFTESSTHSYKIYDMRHVHPAVSANDTLLTWSSTNGTSFEGVADIKKDGSPMWTEVPIRVYTIGNGVNAVAVNIDSGKTDNEFGGLAVAGPVTESPIVSTALTIIESPNLRPFPVLIGSSIFPIKYNTTNADIANITANKASSTISIQLSNVTSDGRLSLVIPDGMILYSSKYMILVDDKPAPYKQTMNEKGESVVEVDFHKSSEKIEIQNIHLAPEFPLMSLAILATAIGVIAMLGRIKILKPL